MAIRVDGLKLSLDWSNESPFHPVSHIICSLIWPSVQPGVRASLSLIAPHHPNASARVLYYATKEPLLESGIEYLKIRQVFLFAGLVVV